MLKSYKTEINPTLEQIQKINKTIGTCRFVYNFNLARYKEVYEKEKKFISGMDFSKWLNNIYLKENPEYVWIKEVSSKYYELRKGIQEILQRTIRVSQIQEKRQIGW